MDTHSAHHHVRPKYLMILFSESLGQIMASPDIIGADDPFQAFSDALLNFHLHYCKDLHTSK